MNTLKDFNLKTSLEIFVEGFIILAKIVYLLGFYTGKATFSTKSWILQTLEEAKTEIHLKNWNNFQFLLPLYATLRLTLRPIYNLLIDSYQYLNNTPIYIHLTPHQSHIYREILKDLNGSFIDPKLI